jgi:hypothetical protein
MCIWESHVPGGRASSKLSAPSSKLQAPSRPLTRVSPCVYGSPRILEGRIKLAAHMGPACVYGIPIYLGGTLRAPICIWESHIPEGRIKLAAHMGPPCVYGPGGRASSKLSAPSSKLQAPNPKLQAVQAPSSPSSKQSKLQAPSRPLTRGSPCVYGSPRYLWVQ